MKKLTHLDDQGRARMVDVGDKPATSRRAVASARVRLSPETRRLVLDGSLPKGDAVAVSRLAGIQGAKLTSQLVPLCHPLALDAVRVELAEADDGVTILAEARTRAATGVEMEALTAAATAALALVDMVKSVERGVTVEALRLELKEGGTSGRWQRDGFGDPFAEPA
jgi:cyclic pyranopterin phosphate synthase